MTKDPSIPRRNKVNWHYVRDDQMFTKIKLVSRHQNTQQFGAILPIELTNKDIRNSAAYKKYYVVASGAVPPKTKASIRKTRSSSDTTITPPTAAGTRLLTLAKGKQPAKSSKAKGLSVLSEIKLATKRSLQQTHISQASGSGTDEGTGIIPGVPDVPTDEFDEEISWKSSDQDDDESSSVSSQFVTSMLNPSPDAGIDSLFETTLQVDVQASTTVAPLTLTAPTLSPPTSPTISQTLEANFSEFVQTNQFAGVVSFIPGIVKRYMDQRMNEAVKIIKDQVKEHVKVQVSKILPKIKKTMNEQLEAEVLTRSSNSSKTSYAVAADISEMELKKILIEKIESNKSIQRSDKQRNLYKALVDAYESDKIILDTYGDTITLKIRKKPESTSALKEKATKTTGKSTQGSKSHQKIARESAPAEEPMQTTQDLEKHSHQEFETGSVDDQPIIEASQHPEWFQQQKKPPTPDRAWNKTLPATQGNIQPLISDLAKQADSSSSFNELMDTPVDFLAFLMNRLKVDTLTPELLAGPTYELMKGACKSVESYQKKLNLTKPDMYRSDLKRKEAYTAYSNPRGFIYQNKDKQNRLMRINELHKFSDGTLNDVRTALEDRLKLNQMKYLPQAIWIKSDKERAATMIQAIDK
nr:hypothetical protein [Tanacetum cinerariifolium]